MEGEGLGKGCGGDLPQVCVCVSGGGGGFERRPGGDNIPFPPPLAPADTFAEPAGAGLQQLLRRLETGGDELSPQSGGQREAAHLPLHDAAAAAGPL